MIDIVFSKDVSSLRLDTILLDDKAQFLNTYSDIINVCSTCKALVAYDQSELVGFIVFTTSGLTIDIGFGFVKEAYSRRGVYSNLWCSLISWGKETGYNNIKGFCSNTNEAIMAFNDKHDRIVEQGMYSYLIT